MKPLLLSFALFFCCCAEAQFNQRLAFDLQKDKAWTDSMKAIVSKGLPDYNATPSGQRRQLKYVNSCVMLGLYYEKMFDKKQLSNMQPALTYYNKVTELGNRDEGGLGRNYEAVAIRNNLNRRLSTIYFKGKGVKKNIATSYSYALSGIGYNPAWAEAYGQRYFHNSNLIISKFDTNNLQKDPGMLFILNPFLYYAKPFLKTADKKQLNALAELYKQQADTNYVITLFRFTPVSMLGQNQAYRMLDIINVYLTETLHISKQHVSYNTEMNRGPSTTKYRGLDVPYLNVYLTLTPSPKERANE